MRESVDPSVRGTWGTRRQVLGAAAVSGGLVLSGTLTSCRVRWDDGSTDAPPAPTADQSARSEAVGSVRALVALAGQVHDARPATKAALADVQDLHRHHLVALGEPMSVTTATPATATGSPPASTTPASTTASAASTAATTASSSVTNPGTSSTPSITPADLTVAEKAEAVRIRTGLPELSGELARTLASIAACCDVLGDLVQSSTTAGARA